MKTIHNTYLDLSKLTMEEIIEVYTILKDEIILEETKKDLMTGTISEGFKYLFFSPSGWNQNDYPLNNKTEVSLSEFRELFLSERPIVARRKNELADKIIKIMEDAGLTPNEMLDVLKLIREKLTAKSK